MKDVYFDSYNKKRYKSDSKYQTSEIPLTKSEREYQDKINEDRYKKIIKNQRDKQNSQSKDPYALYSSEDYYVRQQDIQRVRQPDRQRAAQTKQHNNNQKADISRSSGKQSKPKKKHGCGCFTGIVCFLLIFSLLVGGGSLGYLYSLCKKTNYIESSPNEYISTSELMSSDDVYNVLLLGTDEDEYGTSRSDTMMLVSLDKKHKMVKFTSFMRDMWVDIPDSRSAKINASFAYGGAQLTMDTIEYNFKIDINNYVMVNFDMFKQLIDSLGGVTVDITEKEAEFINRTSHAKVTSGTNTLNGDYALIYCRIRKLDSDFMRTQRQRKVMAALLQKVKSQSIFKTLKAMSDIIPLITTDISPEEMTKLAISSVSLLTYGNDQMQLPEDDAYSSENIGGQDALVPDLDKNVQDLQKFIYE